MFALRRLRQIARQFVHERGNPAHFLHLLQLRFEVLQIETFARFEFFSQARGFHMIDLALRLLNQAQHIAHAEDALRHTVGVKRLEPREFFRDTREFNRLARHLPHRQGRAAARIAIQLGQHYAG